MEDKDKDLIENDVDFNITDHIIKKENTNWEEKWNKNTTIEDENVIEDEDKNEDNMFIQQPNNYALYLRPSYQPEFIEVKSNEPWYRRFENNRNNNRGNKKGRR